MYIAVLDEFPDYMTPTLVAHAVLRHELNKYNLHEDEEKGLDLYCLYSNWRNESFRKVVVRVSQKEFDKIKQLEGVILSWENSTLGGKESCATIVVGDDIPKVLRFAKLWEPRCD